MHWKSVSCRNAVSATLLFITLTVLPSVTAGQDLRGVVRGVDHDTIEPLAGAHVYWLHTKQGVITDASGRFFLHGEGITDRRIVVSHIAYESQTIDAGSRKDIDVTLTSLHQHETDEVEISAQAPDTYVAPMVQKTEVITAEELEHAACCDLSGCFGTTSSVQPEAVDIVTDVRQLSMLGLDGVYTQVLVDNTPHLISGLNSHLGVSFIPGPFIDRITVSKGANSVLQGSESFSGLINVLMHESDENKPLFFNAFTNSFLEQQYNAYVMRASGHWSGMLAAQGIRRGVRVDRNGDGFLDAPLTDRFSALLKWKYDGEDEGIISRSGIKYTWEDRLGGQEPYERDQHLGGTGFYGQLMQNRRIELYDKTEFAVGEDQAIIVHAAASLHTQDAWYGTTRYEAEERSAYLDFAYAVPWQEDQKLTIGASYRFSELDELIGLGSNPHDKTYSGSYAFDESVPGVYAENTSHFLDDALTVVAGLRADVHRDHGTIITPRSFARYNLDEMTTLRASVGTAFRVARPFAEHPAVLASWRDVRLPETLDGERALNYGVNLTRFYDAGLFSGTFALDLYRTEFSRQVIAEYDDHPSAILFRNLDGSSASDNILAEVTADLSWLSTRFSYTYADVYEMRGGERRTLPFVAKHRVLSVLTARSSDDAWQGTVTFEWRGAQRLPETAAYPEEFRLQSQSDPYTLLHLHVQRSWESFDLYAGMENVLDFRQDNPIINAANPFDRYFEPGFSWGPVKGREAYAGIRARLNVFQ
ncbi:MAG: TonB-dependent receptor [Bacteroidetes bacterium]|nr:TonB-dependent receptor [Bacteroidota bacterium]